MLGKLIKHECLATVRKMMPVLFLMLGMSVISGFVQPVLEKLAYESARTQPTLERTLRMFSGLIWTVTAVSYLIVGVVAVIELIDRFYKNVLGNEGYTTMTLPVSVHEILWSKLIVFYVWFLVVSVCELNGILFIAREELKPYDMIEIVRDIVRMTYGHTFEILIFTFAGFSASCLQIYAAMMIGQMYGRYRIAVSVAAYIVLASITGILGIGGTLAILARSAVREFLFSDTNMHGLIWLLIFVAAIPGVICYLITSIGMEKRLNLE